MKLFCFYTESHQVFKDEFFLPSMKDDFEVVAIRGEQTSSAAYMEPGWTSLTTQKAEAIVQALNTVDDQVLVFSDVDIQFIAPVQDALLQHIADVDLVVQRDSPEGVLCSGFFAIRSNHRTRKLWDEVLRGLRGGEYADDQDALNGLLAGPLTPGRRSQRALAAAVRVFGVRILPRVLTNRFGVRWRYLPPSFLSGGTLARRIWEPGMPLELPPGTLLHHANWTRGVANKILLMHEVRRIATTSAPDSGEQVANT